MLFNVALMGVCVWVCVCVCVCVCVHMCACACAYLHSCVHVSVSHTCRISPLCDLSRMSAFYMHIMTCIPSIRWVLHSGVTDAMRVEVYNRSFAMYMYMYDCTHVPL